MVIPRYCPACGGERLKPETNKRWVCGACAFRYYHNVATAVAVVLRVEEATLLTERARDPQQGFLDFPGGFVDPEETLEDAAVRELKEELGLQVDGGALRYRFSLWNRYPYAGVTYPTSDVYFELNLPVRPVLRCADDVAGAYWFPSPGAIPRDKLAFPAVVEAVELLTA